MNDSKIIDRLSCLICFPAPILFIPSRLYYTIDKTKDPWKKKVDLLLYPDCLIMKNSDGVRDYFYSRVRWQDLRSVTVQSQGSLNLFVALVGSMGLSSFLLLFITIKLFFYPEPPPTDLFSFLLIGGVLGGLFTGFLLILQLPKYCLQLKTDSELYVLTLKNTSDFSTMKSFAERIVETVNSH